MGIIEISILTAKIILGIALAIVSLIAIGFVIFAIGFIIYMVILILVDAVDEIKEKINKNKSTNEND